jgi:SAM-dependent methyltransferase
MAHSNPVPASFPTEKTFSSYTYKQGTEYAEIRPTYHPNLYRAVINHHTSTGGELNTILDVGCGPGFAVRGLAPHFAHAIGLDPSEGMIETAQSLGGASSTSEPIRFEISTAEELGQNLASPISNSSVDLITASNAAHWFDMTRFWPRAAQVLKPGGTVAIWGTGSIRVHHSMPNHAAIQAAIDENEEQHLKPYFEPGNLLTRNRYLDLSLPWTLNPNVSEFNEGAFFRKDWTSGGSSADGEEFFAGQQTTDLKKIEKMLSTSSPVTRWRQAHPDAVGTEQDVVKMLVNKIKRLLHEAGVEEGQEVLKGDVAVVMLMVKKKM